jgi:Cu/Ag efflux protein CusF
MRWLEVSLVATLLLASCSPPVSNPKADSKSPAEVKRYELHGEIRELDPAGKIAKIKHQQIGDWMGAMTMEFPVKDPAEFAKLRLGEHIKGTVFVQDLQFWVADITEDKAENTSDQPK